jgi:hypothetical protein
MVKPKTPVVPRVFLSHSSKDQWISERLKEKLEEVGVEVWLDAFDLPGGRNGTPQATASVFISHSPEDSEMARDLARRLRAAGLTPIVDFADLPAGKDWKKTIREQIRTADAMLILVTPAALRSGYMMVELGMAEGFERMVLPVTAGLKPRDMPAPLQSYQAAPFDQVDGAISALAERLTTAASA